VKFVLDDGVARDFGQGALSQTGARLRPGHRGPGLLQDLDGRRRALHPRRPLHHRPRPANWSPRTARPCSTTAAARSLVDPIKGPVSIARDGSVSQGAERIGKIGVVRIADLASLRKDGDNLYRNTSNDTPQPATDAIVRQGMLEASNVQSIQQITRLIEVSRAYESVAKMMDQTAELSRRRRADGKGPVRDN
jgi:flagellar basal-body rod protein FlgF